MDKDLQKIFESVSSDILSEDVKTKLGTLIEARLIEKVNAKTAEIEAKFETEKAALTESLEEKAVQFVDEHLLDKIDEYMDYAADEYVKENELQITDGLKAQLFENIVTGVKGVLAENQIKEEEVKEQTDAFEKNKELQSKLDEAIKANMEVKKELQGEKANAIFEQVTADCTDLQVEKIKSIAKEFDIDDLGEFRTKVSTLVENFSAISDNNDEENKDNDSNSLNESNDFGEEGRVKVKVDNEPEHPIHGEIGGMWEHL